MEHGYEDADSVLRNLSSLPIIPLADGRVVALSEEGVFFPMEESQTSKKKSPSQTGKSERTGCCALCSLVCGGCSVFGSCTPHLFLQQYIFFNETKGKLLTGNQKERPMCTFYKYVHIFGVIQLVTAGQMIPK